jgi:hypothetical protein
MKKSVWRGDFGEEGLVHVVPVGDLREHFLSLSCWCRPRTDELGVVVHHSLDRREEHEPKGEA